MRFYVSKSGRVIEVIRKIRDVLRATSFLLLVACGSVPAPATAPLLSLIHDSGGTWPRVTGTKVYPNGTLEFSDARGIIRTRERNALLLSLNTVTGNEYGTNNNGELTVIKYGPNASPTATQFLDAAIASTNIYMVNAINNSAVNSMNSYQATGDINIDFADFRNTKSSGLSSEAFGLGSNLLHELVHVDKLWNDPPRAGTPGVPVSLDAKHITGPVVDFVNQIHRERGLPERGPSYAPQNTDRTIGGRVRVPFIDPRTGRMVYVWPKLRP